MFIATLIGALLPITQIEIQGVSLTVEVADTAPSRELGLMHRETLSPDHGMLFVYNQPEILNFWMKNTKIPLSIAFCDEDRFLKQIEDMYPPEKKDSSMIPTYRSKAPAQYAIEVPLHWFQEHGIGIGDRFTIKGTP